MAPNMKNAPGAAKFRTHSVRQANRAGFAAEMSRPCQQAGYVPLACRMPRENGAGMRIDVKPDRHRMRVKIKGGSKSHGGPGQFVSSFPDQSQVQPAELPF